MNITDAIVFLRRGAGGGTPALLEPLLLAPGAEWLSEAFRRMGVERFLVICHPDDQQQAAKCFPARTDYVTGDMADANAKLLEFLDGCAGGVAVLTGPVLLTDDGVRRLADPAPLPAGDPCGVYRIDATALSNALSQGVKLEQALYTRGETFGYRGDPADGVFPLTCSRQDRQRLEARLRRSQADRLADAGVRMLDPDSVYIDPAVTVGAGTLLLPGTILRGRTRIGENCEIGPNTMLRDCLVGQNVTINASQCNESVIGDRAKVGPFAYVRPGCTIGSDTKVGDFVEVKNSVIGDGTKISHLTYVGDSDLGKNVNLGCGTVTVNYDGAAKFRTVVGDNAFVGCNTNLIAPVHVGEGSYIAAGSTITDNVPPDSLAIARAPQVIKTQWAARRRKK